MVPFPRNPHFRSSEGDWRVFYIQATRIDQFLPIWHQIISGSVLPFESDSSPPALIFGNVGLWEASTFAKDGIDWYERKLLNPLLSEFQKRPAAPGIWLPMNRELYSPLYPKLRQFQPQYVETANAATFAKFRSHNSFASYWDSNQMIPFSDKLDEDTCTDHKVFTQLERLQDDGVHFRQWVDIVRAQILLGLLCDASNTLHLEALKHAK